MDLASAFISVNWFSVLIAGISSFLLGGIWYGPLFGRIWMRAFHFTEEDLKKRKISKTFGLSLILACIAALLLEMFIGVDTNLIFGMTAGLLAGIGWVATFTGIQYLFEMKSLTIFFINAGYSVLSLTLMGAILGAW